MIVLGQKYNFGGPCGAFLGGLGAAQKGPAGLAIGKTRKKQRKKQRKIQRKIQRKETKEKNKGTYKGKNKPFRNPKIPDTKPRPGLKAYRARTPGRVSRNTLFQKFAKKETAKC